MNSSEIIELVRAGYTKAEIEAMNVAEPTAPQEPTEQTTPQELTEPTEPTAPQENANGSYKELANLVKSLTETVKAMQADNARKVSGEVPQKANAESAIKSFFEDTPKD